MAVADRRSSPRSGLRLPIAYRQLAAGPPVPRHGVTLDVSRCGVRFRSDAFLPPGVFVAVEMSLPHRAAYVARGRTVWAREARGDGHWEVGAEFLRSGGDADAALAETLLFSA
jgi:hypothetical protein